MKASNRIIFGLCLAAKCVSVASFITNARPFVLQSTSMHTSTRIHTKIYSTNGSGSGSDDKSRLNQEQEKFMEREAIAGADKIRVMSIEERTKRAMLAEVAEDGMIKLSDELDELLGEDGMPKREEDREEIVTLCKQIKASQDQYKALVNGEDSPLLNTLEETGDWK
mmetsp:Transcript_1701/g.2422  ORF Transcript_1701/g.2422 Transcript_1701/m.2422 type:complete len:167 (-) Transcript_1701:293-793(-)